MNAETIDLLKKVQGRRGEWRVFDYCWHLKFKDGLGVVLGTGKNSVLSIYFRGMDHHSYCEPDDPDLLWLPPPTPRWPGDDNRNLWDIAKNVLKEPLLKSFSGCDYFEIYTGSDYPWLVVASGRSLHEALLRVIDEKK